MNLTLRAHLTVASLSLCAIAGACSRVDAASLAGRYAMTTAVATDTLELRADGRYSRRYFGREATATDSGRWFLTKDARLVGLRDFPKRHAFVHDRMFDTTKGRALATPTTVALTIERSMSGTVNLGWHSDWGWTFKRMPGS